MPVGATIGSAVVSGGASIAGGMMGASAQRRAANQATASADRTAQMNNALQREMYATNQAYLAPYAARGNDAGNQINALLGLGGSSASGGGGGVGYGAAGGYGVAPQISEDEWATNAMNALQAEVSPSLWARVNGIQDPSDRLAALEPMMFRRDREAYGNFTAGSPRPTATAGATQPGPAAGATNADGTPQTAQQAATAAYEMFRGSTGYQSRLDEANNSMNSAYAARGTLQSGAAQIAMARMNQDYASNEFGNYMGFLGNQQGVGMAGASAIAGVGQSYANSVSANNNNASRAAQNAAYGRGNATAGMWGNVAGAVGGIASALGSSYGVPRR